MCVRITKFNRAKPTHQTLAVKSQQQLSSDMGLKDTQRRQQ